MNDAKISNMVNVLPLDNPLDALEKTPCTLLSLAFALWYQQCLGSQHYKVLALMQRPKSVAIYQKWLRQTKLQRKIFVGRRCHSNRGERFAQQLSLVL